MSSWQNSVGNPKDFVYMRDVLLQKKLKEHQGIQRQEENVMKDGFFKGDNLFYERWRRNKI